MNNPNQTVPRNPLLRRVKGLMLGRVIVITFLWVALVMVELTGDPTPTRLPLTYLILITAMSGRVVSANHAAERILLLPPGTRQGWMAQEVLSFIDLVASCRRLKRLIGGSTELRGCLSAVMGKKSFWASPTLLCAMTRGRSMG
jgi:hypothetical protein